MIKLTDIVDEKKDLQSIIKAKQYFDTLSQLICDQLDMAGYRFCDGNNMAKNPKWCQPLSQWKNYFSRDQAR